MAVSDLALSAILHLERHLWHIPCHGHLSLWISSLCRASRPLVCQNGIAWGPSVPSSRNGWGFLASSSPLRSKAYLLLLARVNFSYWWQWQLLTIERNHSARSADTFPWWLWHDETRRPRLRIRKCTATPRGVLKLSASCFCLHTLRG